MRELVDDSTPGLFARLGRAQGAALLATSADVLLFTGLVRLAPGFAFSMALLAAAAGGVVAFFLNRHWSFQASQEGLRSQALRWLSIWLCSALLNGLLVVELLSQGVSPAPARILTGLVIGLGFNFPLHNYFVFSESRT